MAAAGLELELELVELGALEAGELVPPKRADRRARTPAAAGPAGPT